LDLASPSKRLPSHRPVRQQADFPSASHGIRSRVCPAVDISCCASTPRHCCQCRSAQPPPGDRVAFRQWFLTTWTVYSAQRPRVCCAPKPTGVHCVLRWGTPSAACRSSLWMKSRPKSRPSLPAMRFTPSKEFPSPVAVPRHRDRYLRAVRFAPPTAAAPKRCCDLDTRRQVNTQSPSTAHTPKRETS